MIAQIAKDFEDFDPKTAVSTNVYGHVTGTKVNFDQCLRGLLRVLRVYTPEGAPPLFPPGSAANNGPYQKERGEIRNPTAEIRRRMGGAKGDFKFHISDFKGGRAMVNQ